MSLCVVLAGGAGQRMGGRKPQRLYRGRPLGEHALSLAAGFASRVAFSVREHQQAEGLPPVELIFDPPEIEGPLAGVVGGLRHGAQTGAVLVLTIPCDTPHLPDDLFRRLEAALVSAPEAMAASALDQQRSHPACTLWRVEALEPALAYARAGHRSLRGLLAELKTCQVYWGDPHCTRFLNVNTVADLAASVGQTAAPTPPPA